MTLFLKAAIILLISFPAMAQSQAESSQGCVKSANPTLCLFIERGEIPDSGRPYQKQIQQFYAADHYNLAWLQAGKPTSQALAMIQAFQGSANQGLQPEDYDAPRWNERFAHISLPASSEDLARLDLSLTAFAMRYISNLCCGRVDPRRLNMHLDVDYKRCNFPDFLRSRVIHASDVAAALQQIEPPYAGYQKTQAALSHYLALAKEGEGEPLPRPRKTIEPGDTYPGVAALANRLRRVGDLPPDAPTPQESALYEGAVVQAVKHFQQRHGLAADGRIDAATFRELTIRFSVRVKQLQFTLERYRWLPANLPPRLIVVNIPEFTLRAYNDHHPAFSMRVIVGKAYHEHQTPVFQDEMEYLIFRPYWNVPIRIVRKELVPDIQKKSGYLAKHQFELVDGRGKAAIPETITPDVLQQLRVGKLDVRQKPGSENSLGLIKFVFPNHFDVYLHGTPEQQLFSRSRRDFSHGCIRVEDPAILAQWVLGDDPSWTMDRIQSAMNGNKSLRVDLREPILVMILYGTALVEENGEVHFFRDIYGQDARLERAMAAQDRY